VAVKTINKTMFYLEISTIEGLHHWDKKCKHLITELNTVEKHKNRSIQVLGARMTTFGIVSFPREGVMEKVSGQLPQGWGGVVPQLGFSL
jgi:hypothetical protein